MPAKISPGQSDRPIGNRNPNLRIVLWILILVAAAEFVVRGPGRFLQPINWNDLAQNYAASRLWVRGQNPSDAQSFADLWLHEVKSPISAHTARTHLAPPLGSLVLLAPIALLPWPVAKIVWCGIELLAFALTLVALMRVSDLRPWESTAVAFIAGSLGLAPYHTGIGAGNVTVVVIAACAVAIWAAKLRRDVAAGILFAVACTFKPHIGAFFVLYYLIRGRWRLFAIALASTAGLALAAVLWFQIRGVSWFTDYIHNARGFVTANRFDDFSSANPIRFMLINLQVPFFSITGSTKWANVLALSAGAVLVSLWIYWSTREQNRDSALLSLAAIAVICLLPMYHRLYDAALLVIPLCWCLTLPAGPRKKPSRIALVLMAPFLAPGAAVLQQLASQGHIPNGWTQSWWWNCVIMPHQTWLLALLALVLLYAMSQKDSAALPES